MAMSEYENKMVALRERELALYEREIDVARVVGDGLVVVANEAAKTFSNLVRELNVAEGGFGDLLTESLDTIVDRLGEVRDELKRLADRHGV